MNTAMSIQKQKIDNLFLLIRDIEDEEIHAHWAKYLCVLISGFIENSLRISITEYVQDKSHPNISQYINTNIQRVTNLNTNKISNLLSSFNEEWKKTFITCTSEEERDAINTIVANRHIIAHGKDVGLTLTALKIHYEKVVSAVEKICFNCIVI
ncbi:HEPN domain-containing protein [Paenibacillus sp. YPG26]|uniref:HEPN domain-containing protein n=1 Tax=Paenibacillus sp. YPG26 TaxID=2878915 RepID=UPI002040FDEE|nr:HEPN domain-containing protein [Paenibacillus sp. YPG26]USB33932.1 hypothetical protein LDO05_03680 [Paenibacillus sp. YPG26]